MFRQVIQGTHGDRSRRSFKGQRIQGTRGACPRESSAPSRTPKKLMAACLVLLLGPSLLAGCFGGEAPDANRTPSSEEAPVQGSTNSPEAQYRRITAAQARDMMDSGDPYILLDVRSVEEYHEGYIANAILIPHAEIKGRAAGELADLDATILVYCRSGVRSSAAAHDLVALGYTGVYDMGGIMDWPYGTVQD